MRRVILLILDGVGIGAMEDVPKVRPADVGSDTLRHVAEAVGGLRLPHLESLGLGNIHAVPGVTPVAHPLANWGTALLRYLGADSFLGHQELMGARPRQAPEELFEAVRIKVIQALQASGHDVQVPFPDRPALLVDKRVVVGDNLESDPLQTYHCVGSLDELDLKRVESVAGIVRQVARVRRVVAMGGHGFTVQDMLRCVERRPSGQTGINNVALGLYTKDYVVRHLTLDVDVSQQLPAKLAARGVPISMVGKIADIVRADGARMVPLVDTRPILRETLATVRSQTEGFIAVNVQDTDLAGHDENPRRFADVLELCDQAIGELWGVLAPGDVLLITSDHGNDPSIGHDKHTREAVPVLAYVPARTSRPIPTRHSLADLAATVAELLGADPPESGESFAPMLEEPEEGLRSDHV